MMRRLGPGTPPWRIAAGALLLVLAGVEAGLAQVAEPPAGTSDFVSAVSFDLDPAPAAVPIEGGTSDDASVDWWEDDYVEGLTLRRTIAPATLITLGLFTFRDEGTLSRGSVYEWRNEFIPDFENHVDDLGQFAAGVLALGLNAAGVPGRHSLGRSAVTYAASMGVMMVGVHSIKALSDVQRPSGGTSAFPSGHTAASFASARFLDREYGPRSDLYSLAGYGIAAGTGVFRQLNNAHWLSDVLVGAGIGLLSTDIAYAIVDEIYGDKGVNPLPEPGPARPRGNPSFLDFRAGAADLTGDVDDREGRFTVGGGWTAGIEGAWFFKPWLGVGGEWSVGSFPIDNSGFVIEDPEIDEIVSDIYTQPLGAESYYAGPFVNLALGNRWSLGGKLTAGVSLPATGKITAAIEPDFQEQVGGPELPLYQYEGQSTFGWAVGGAIRWMAGERIGIRAFVEWNSSHPNYEFRAVTGIDEDGSPIYGPVVEVADVDFSYLGFGLGASALLW